MPAIGPDLFTLIAVYVPLLLPDRIETREVTGIFLYADQRVKEGFRELLASSIQDGTGFFVYKRILFPF